jgi:hypothetical protein
MRLPLRKILLALVLPRVVAWLRRRYGTPHQRTRPY